MRRGGMKTPWIIVIPVGAAALFMAFGMAHVVGAVVEGVSNGPMNSGPG